MLALKNYNFKKLVYSAFFTSLIILGGFISIPIGFVPIILADFFIMVSASFQSPIGSLVSIILYILLGLLGLPVFAGGKAGLSVITGPTGGFVIGYVFLSFLMSLMLYNKDYKKKNIAWYLISALVSNAVLYFIGTISLMHNLSLNLEKALKIAVLPFIFGSILKIFISYLLYKKIEIKI